MRTKFAAIANWNSGNSPIARHLIVLKSCPKPQWATPSPMQTPQAAAIDKYISTGAHDPDDGTWAGDNFLARLSTAKAALRNALIETVCTRTRDAKLPATLPAIDPTSLSRAKVAPLVRGLLPRKE